MSVRRLAPDHVQPASFAFTPANENWADQQIAKYPAGRQASAVIPLLWKAQEQHHGWVPRAAIEAVAKMLDMAPMRVMEIATFYTMFNLQPVGEHYIQLCGTTPCVLRGAEALKKVCEDVIGPQSTVTADGKLSWLEVECLGACCNAPMVQINFDYYEDLTPENFRALLDDLRHGRPTKPGPQNGRSGSEPEGGGETLKDPALYRRHGDRRGRLAEAHRRTAQGGGRSRCGQGGRRGRGQEGRSRGGCDRQGRADRCQDRAGARGGEPGPPEAIRARAALQPRAGYALGRERGHQGYAGQGSGAPFAGCQARRQAGEVRQRPCSQIATASSPISTACTTAR